MSSIPGSTSKDGCRPSTAVDDANTPTVAAFSPFTFSNTASGNKKRSSILIHQKSSLLIATPPQIINVLSNSHLFLSPLNELIGLVTWTSGNSWESFLVVAAFWATTLYGDLVIRFAGPLIFAIVLILGVYSRRNQPSSSPELTGEKQLKKQLSTKIYSEKNQPKHQRSLEEIVATLKIFTDRCHILFEPFTSLFETLAVQPPNPVSSKSFPLLARLLIRILFLNFIWITLNLRPIHIISTKRAVLVIGTLFLTWHSPASRVTRAILWRSSRIRRLCSVITGLPLVSPGSAFESGQTKLMTTSQDSHKNSLALVTNLSTNSSQLKLFPTSPGVRFTFVLYENQRRWVGLGWTTNLFFHERAAWTDEHQNPASTKDAFELPNTDNSTMAWKWVEGSKWLVDGAGETDEGGIKAADGADGGMGWIYYDNKWQMGRRGIDGWGCYTRRRKWYRDAELVEVTAKVE